jgi:hypothetical protein
LLLAGFAPAQNQPDTSARDQQDPTFEGPSILNRQSGLTDSIPLAPALGPSDSSTLEQQEPAFEGPSILSRDSGLLDSTGKPIQFGMFAKFSGVYDSGLTPVIAAGQATPLATQAGLGLETSFGAAFSRRWRRSKISIEYRAAYRKYAAASLLNGLDQFFQLAYSRVLQSHLILDFKTTLGTTTLANGAFTYLPLSTLDLLGLPTNELFDNRTNYLQSRVDLTWQKTARLSFGLGGDGFVVRRQSLLLAGLNGYSARANVAYRLTPRQTISASYNNTYFDYQRAFGNSRLQIPALGYSLALTRLWDFSTQAGVARVATLGLTQVALDPALAALLGESYATVTFSRVSYLPVAEARLIRRFKTSSLTFDYAMGVTPGNGYYLTSRQTSGTIGYSYIAGKTWELRGNAAFNELTALGQALGKYNNMQTGAEVFYNLTPAAHLDVRYDYRHYTTENVILQKDSSRVSLGLAFSLGDLFESVR